ncbi:MarR family winged helix-turn-helix transcriptional regulator [Kibdelosporangium phytohabitans]|uniref:MarR family transcriptional regulator n=1 Tax=Kibdelosporangium phytohabitans TaxID=860235 RepID=A0A0N9HTA7_9PSEU|nr:MarR family transcriptional regulator [Kibdelosporangium phytohabitans]ALG08216.1 MarR family transcriptional regulator [Kibdelosporangium phytohabitans]MBE1470781.1 DNA-binding MarR family transcriptional regulator [Kibdelosporangium phytohabitans]
MLSVAELTRVMEEFTRMHIRLPVAQRLSFTTLSVLHTLAARGPLRMTELAADEQVTQPAITQTVTKLEQEGRVERHPHPTDRRAVLVHVTNAGRTVVESRRAERTARLTELADQLTEEERTAIAMALPALKRIVELNQQETS